MLFYIYNLTVHNDILHKEGISHNIELQNFKSYISYVGKIKWFIITIHGVSTHFSVYVTHS